MNDYVLAHDASEGNRHITIRNMTIGPLVLTPLETPCVCTDKDGSRSGRNLQKLPSILKGAHGAVWDADPAKRQT